MVSGSRKILIAYYSRTGTTKKVAEAVAKLLKCDVDEMTDNVKRSGPIGYLKSGRDAMKRRVTHINTSKDPSLYDLVVIATPLWAGRASTPAFSYATKNKELFKKVAFIITRGGTDDQNTVSQLEKACGKKSITTLSLKTKDVWKGNIDAEVGKFVKGLKAR